MACCWFSQDARGQVPLPSREPIDASAVAFGRHLTLVGSRFSGPHGVAIALELFPKAAAWAAGVEARIRIGGQVITTGADELRIQGGLGGHDTIVFWNRVPPPGTVIEVEARRVCLGEACESLTLAVPIR